MKVIGNKDRSEYGPCVFCGCHAMQFDYENGLSDLSCCLSVDKRLPCHMKTISRLTSDADSLRKHWIAGGLL